MEIGWRARQVLADDLEKGPRGKWLGDIFIASGLAHDPLFGRHGKCRHDDDGDQSKPFIVFQPAQDIETGHDRQLNVENDEIRLLGIHEAHGLFPVMGAHRDVAAHFQKIREKHRIEIVILNDQDNGLVQLCLVPL